MARAGEDQLHVLIIDDDPSIRGLLTEIVTREEHVAVPAVSAEQGLEQLPFWTFQVAFIDQRLPGMDGFVLGEYLHHNNPDMTIALITGEQDRQLERRIRALSMTYIPKPFEVEQILRVLRHAITSAKDREIRRQKKADPDFNPPIAKYAADVQGAFDMPGMPSRVEGRLLETIKRGLSDLRTVGRYTEKARVITLSGLLAANVLGIKLPKNRAGNTLHEEYDEIMRMHGRRPEFEES